eukprot:scaffold389618_cov17-Prasinocladus_malaysianus.AAC.1
MIVKLVWTAEIRLNAIFATSFSPNTSHPVGTYSVLVPLCGWQVRVKCESSVVEFRNDRMDSTT